jgi:hypothetical protein
MTSAKDDHDALMRVPVSRDDVEQEFVTAANASCGWLSRSCRVHAWSLPGAGTTKGWQAPSVSARVTAVVACNL